MVMKKDTKPAADLAGDDDKPPVEEASAKKA